MHSFNRMLDVHTHRNGDILDQIEADAGAALEAVQEELRACVQGGCLCVNLSSCVGAQVISDQYLLLLASA